MIDKATILPSEATWQSAVFDLGEAPASLLAAGLAPLLQAGDILCLEGDLGAGKSSFARAFLRAYCKDAALEVPSPSFSLVQTYETSAGPEIWHADLYRLEDASELEELGFEEAQSQAIFLIEWPQLLPDYFQQAALYLSFAASSSPDRRLLSFKGRGLWSTRLAALLKEFS